MKSTEIVELMREWKDEIVGVTTDYKEAIGKLEDARKTYEGSFWQNNWVMSIVTVLCTVVILALAVVFVSHMIPHSKISIGTDGITVEKEISPQVAE